MKKYLVFEDGTYLEGIAIGSEVETVGQLVFSTGMSGYQELITDPSANGLVINFTNATLGNYGINQKFNESNRVYAKAILVREIADHPGNYQSEITLDAFLKSQNVPGITQLDTRAITHRLRTQGEQRVAVVNSLDSALRKEIKNFQLDDKTLSSSRHNEVREFEGEGKHLVIVDYGVKHGLVREFIKRNMKVTLVPKDFTPEKIEAYQPDGVLLSNGPGTPELYEDNLEKIRRLQEKYPIMGVGLGHQLLGMANGAEIVKMKVGNRGFNFGVQDLNHNAIYFTAQNHRYTLAEDSLKNTDLEITHKGLEDGSVQGIRHKKYAAQSYQFFPDATPGPRDMRFVFDEFVKIVNKN